MSEETIITDSIQVNQEKQEPIKIIKPKIIKTLLFLSSLVSSIWLLFLFVWLAPSLFLLFENAGIIAIICLIFVFLIIVMIRYFLKKVSLEKIDYKFYDNKLEYYDGFLVKNRRTIKYDKITDIGQKRGIIERIFGLGTVGISTAGSSGYEVSMSYLENSDDVYNWLDSFISQYEKSKK